MTTCAENPHEASFLRAGKHKRAEGGKRRQENYSVRKTSSFECRQLKGKASPVCSLQQKTTESLGVFNQSQVIFNSKMHIDSSKELVVWKFWNLLSRRLWLWKSLVDFFKKEKFELWFYVCAKQFFGAVGLFSNCDFWSFFLLKVLSSRWTVYFGNILNLKKVFKYNCRMYNIVFQLHVNINVYWIF